MAKLIGDKRQPVDTSDRRMHLGAVGDLIAQWSARAPDPPGDPAPLQLTSVGVEAARGTDTLARAVYDRVDG